MAAVEISPEMRVAVLGELVKAGMSRLDAETCLDLSIFAAQEAWQRVNVIAGSSGNEQIADQTCFVATQLLQSMCEFFTAMTVQQFGDAIITQERV